MYLESVQRSSVTCLRSHSYWREEWEMRPGILTPELVPLTRVNICPLFTQMNKSISISKGDINNQYKIYPRHKDFWTRKAGVSGPRVLPPSSSAGWPTLVFGPSLPLAPWGLFRKLPSILVLLKPPCHQYVSPVVCSGPGVSEALSTLA